MFIFCGLYFKAKQDEGKAGTLHVVVVEGNYVALGEPSAKSFMSPPSPSPPPLMYVSVDLQQVVLSPIPLEAT